MYYFVCYDKKAVEMSAGKVKKYPGKDVWSVK